METICIDCGKRVRPPKGSMGTGVAHRPADNILGKPVGPICYDCCARDDQASMLKTGNSKNLPLYLATRNGRQVVQNWPGTLRYVITNIRKGNHNIASQRTDVWFRDANNDRWWGVNYGEFDIVHCKRIK